MIDTGTLAPVSVVTLIILIEYFAMTFFVGRARGVAKIDAPATSGDPMFERYFRAHQNTLERIAIVIPAMWLFALYVQPLVAAGIGLIFAFARLWYFRCYTAEPARRGPAFGIGMLAELALLLGALGGAARAWIG